MLAPFYSLKRIYIFAFWNVQSAFEFSHKSQDLVDIEVFQEAKRVIDALENKDIAPALAWCSDNKSRLKKSKVYVVVPKSLSFT